MTASQLINELRKIFIEKRFFVFYVLFIQWDEDMAKSVHPLARGKDHGDGQSSQKKSY